MRQLQVDLIDVESAYLAGLVDGEGCLNFYHMTSRTCTLGYTFVARMTITNKDVETLMWIRQRLGMGRVRQKPIDRKFPNRGPAYDLTFCAREVKFLLPHILPYMRIKRKQGELVLAYVQKQKLGGTKSGISQEDHQWRIETHAKLRELNRRGLPQVMQN